MKTHLPVASSNQAQGLTLPRRVGLLGGVSWHSTLEYYKIINTVVQQNLGGLHSAEIIMFSFNFAEVEEHQRRGDWESLTNLIVDEGLRLKNAGAQCLVICSNTLHMMADDVIERVGVPLIHIADSTAELILVQRITQLGLLGTRPTMEGDFYTDRLRKRYNLEVIIPPPEARGEIHRVIFEELCKGDIRDEARVFFEGGNIRASPKRSRRNHSWMYRD